MRALMTRTVVTGAMVSLGLAGCATPLPQKADTPPARPVITQAEAVKVIENYSTVNNKANDTRDARLLATVENGDVLVASSAQYAMMGRLGETARNKHFTLSKDSAFAPPAGAFPQVFLMYSKNSANPKLNVLSVFRRFDAAGSWKRVVSGVSESTLPTIAVDPSGLVTMVTPTAGGYAVRPQDVAPALAKAMRGATPSGGVTFATSPILTQYRKSYADERTSIMGKGSANRVFTPTIDIFAIKTKDGGVLVMGGMDWRQAESYSGDWRYTPAKGDPQYVLHPGQISAFQTDYKAMWAVQIPVKGPLKLVSWTSTWANYSAT